MLLAVVRPAVRREPFFIAAVAALLLLPLYWYGSVNELLYRGSLPALLVLGWLCAGAVARGGGALVRRGGLRRRAAFAGLVLVLGLGALSPAVHLVLSFQVYGSFRYEHAGYTTLVDLPPEWRRQRIAREAPRRLGAGSAVPAGHCVSASCRRSISTFHNACPWMMYCPVLIVPTA